MDPEKQPLVSNPPYNHKDINIKNILKMAEQPENTMDCKGQN